MQKQSRNNRKGRGKYMSNKDICRKFKNEGKEVANDEPSKDSFNDISWYVVDEQILNDAARIPYSTPVGLPFPRRATIGFTGTTTPVHESVYDSAVPGILVSHIMPILGNAKSAGDAVNVAANSIYQFVRSKISGSRPYDAVDFMIYLGAMDSIFSYCTYLTRLYSTVFTYHQANRYLSRALVEAQGVDYDNLVANLSAFRSRFNVMIAKIKSLYVPNNMSVFIRHSWMFSKYYIEGDSDKDQIYLHAPIGYYVFNYDSDGAGMLSAKRLHAGGTDTYDTLLNKLEAMIDPIYQDEDFNRISGDLLKAYEGNVFTISEIPDISTVTLEHNEEVLLQFKNANYYAVSPDSDHFVDNSFDYKQDSSKTYLKFTMTEKALCNYTYVDTSFNTISDVRSTSTEGEIASLASKMMDASKPKLITTPHSDVTPGENMINTRLIVGFTMEYDATSFWENKIDNIAVGTEWPYSYSIFTYRRLRSTGQVTLFNRNYETTIACADNNNNRDLRTLTESQLPILSNFKYHPELFVTVLETDDSVTPNTYVMRNAGRSLFDVDNYALIDFNVINGLHQAAILGQYNVPKLSVGR